MAVRAEECPSAHMKGEPMNHATRSGGLKCVAALVLMVAAIAACGSSRKQVVDLGRARDDDGSYVIWLKGYKKVYQADPSICWAACMEQSLALQGIFLGQAEIASRVHGRGAQQGSQAINSWSWHQHLSIDNAKSVGGKELWFRCDVDRIVLTRKTMVKKLSWELSKRRIALVALKEPGGGGHVYSVVGTMWPDGTTKLTPSRISGFALYDPRTGTASRHSASAMVNRLAFMVYITSFDSSGAAVLGQRESALNR